jgi:hypothetical protein
MDRMLKDRAGVLRAIAVIGAVGAACLSRPVETSSPTLETVFTREIRNQAVDKLDLLFMIDNSESMGDKQRLLAQAVPDMLTRLVTPNCVDLAGNVLAISDMNGQCAMGTPEFPPVHDMHIGIVTSSLGGRGANSGAPGVLPPGTCPASAMNGSNNAHNDDQGHLINRGGDANETPVGKASVNNFLAWYPPVRNNNANAAASAPSNPETVVGVRGAADTLIGDFTSMIEGVHEYGCGFEAQNEAWYRFLVQPDPFDPNGPNAGIPIDGKGRASLAGIDTTILMQRRAFLRPDSLLTIIVVTDENEEVANPLSVDGQGWLYEAAPFPFSPTYGAPEGTIECKSGGPNDPNCTSCAFPSIEGAANFGMRCPNDPPTGVQGYLDPSNDAINVRFFNQKQRFGVFAGYPISRYVRGLTKPSVPDRTREVDGNGNYIGDQDQYANCVNPIFAQDLPTDPKADLCHLTRGPRSPDLIYYAAIAGVPHQLLQAQAGVDAECSAPAVPAGTAQQDCPQKSQLTEADWQLMTGKDPDHWDFTGVDFHMLESEGPRTQSAAVNQSQCPPTSNDRCDPINGREWATNNSDLQFACIFPLVDPQTGTPAPKDCADPGDDACACHAGANTQNTPLCQKNGGTYTTTQIYGKAYPSVRELAIAHAMAGSASGVQGIVSSLCPIHTSYVSGQSDPLYGYRPAVNAIVNRLKISLNVQCLPQKLTQQASTDPMVSGTVPCLLLVTLPKVGAACDGALGLGPPDAGIVARFKAAEYAAWSEGSGLPDPRTLTVCQLTQLLPASFGPDGTCTASTQPGWCYVERQAGPTCAQQILFTQGVPPPSATVHLQCFEHASSAIGGGT